MVEVCKWHDALANTGRHKKEQFSAGIIAVRRKRYGRQSGRPATFQHVFGLSWEAECLPAGLSATARPQPAQWESPVAETLKGASDAGTSYFNASYSQPEWLKKINNCTWRQETIEKRINIVNRCFDVSSSEGKKLLFWLFFFFNYYFLMTPQWWRGYSVRWWMGCKVQLLILHIFLFFSFTHL